jgi:hypothetical protein
MDQEATMLEFKVKGSCDSNSVVSTPIPIYVSLNKSYNIVRRVCITSINYNSNREYSLVISFMIPILQLKTLCSISKQDRQTSSSVILIIINFMQPCVVGTLTLDRMSLFCLNKQQSIIFVVIYEERNDGRKPLTTTKLKLSL